MGRNVLTPAGTALPGDAGKYDDSVVHPIERLRFIARVDDVPTVQAVAEAASALQATAADPMELLTACRRLIAWRPLSAPLVWLAARMIASTDPVAEAQAAARHIITDPTVTELAGALPPGRRIAAIGSGEITGSMAGADPSECDLALVEAEAVCELGALCVHGAAAQAAQARSNGAELWLVVRAARCLPVALWTSMRDRESARAPQIAAPEVLGLEIFERAVGPGGPCTLPQATAHPGCPSVTELFR